FRHLGEPGVRIFLQQIIPSAPPLRYSADPPVEMRTGFDPRQRQLKQLAEMEQFTQSLMLTSRHDRDAFFWDRLTPTDPEQWTEDMKPYQDYLWTEVIGKIPESETPLQPKARKIMDEPKWEGYEVTLNVAPNCFVWGYYLLPKGIKSGEKRPVM